MRIVVVDMQPITPAVGGGRLRLLGLYHGLGDDVEAVYVGSYDWPGESSRDVQLTPSLREVCVPLSPAHHAAATQLSQQLGGKTVIDAAFSTQARLSPAWLSRARAEMRQADVVVFSHPWAFTPLCDALLPRQTVIYDSHNVESLLKATLLGRGEAAAGVVREVVRNEYELCRRADAILCCSDGDMAAFERLFDVPWSKFRLVPNGAFTNTPALDRGYAREKARDALGIDAARPLAVFVGSDYAPNLEAARFIADSLAEEVPDVTLAIVGGAGGIVASGRPPNNVVCTGVVDASLRDLVLQGADLAINPMSSGSGTNIKMFDFLAAGLPVVTTDVGARGICDAASAPDFIKVRALSGFAAAITEVLAAGPIAGMGESPRDFVARLFSWERISLELGRQLVRLHGLRTHSRRRSRAVMFSTWNVTCGIAEHASYIVDAMRDQNVETSVFGNELAGHFKRGFEKDLHFSVARPWTWDNEHWRDSGVDIDAVVSLLRRLRPDFAIVQHHTAFMPVWEYERLLDALRTEGIPALVEFHDARHLNAEEIASFARRADVLQFHDAGEMGALPLEYAAKSVVAPLPVRLARHAQPLGDESNVAKGPVIGGFGFLRPYKGVLTSIRTVAALSAVLPGVRYRGWHALYDEHSVEHLAECMAEAARLGVADRIEIHTAFLPMDEIVSQLAQCDLVLLPYAPADEGASAAVNTVLAAGRVAVVSTSRIFHPVADIVHVVADDDPAAYAAAIAGLLRTPARMRALQEAASTWVHYHSYPAAAERMIALLHACGPQPPQPMIDQMNGVAR